MTSFQTFCSLYALTPNHIAFIVECLYVWNLSLHRGANGEEKRSNILFAFPTNMFQLHDMYTSHITCTTLNTIHYYLNYSVQVIVIVMTHGHCNRALYSNKSTSRLIHDPACWQQLCGFFILIRQYPHKETYLRIWAPVEPPPSPRPVHLQPWAVAGELSVDLPPPTWLPGTATCWCGAVPGTGQSTAGR